MRGHILRRTISKIAKIELYMDSYVKMDEESNAGVKLTKKRTISLVKDNVKLIKLTHK